MLTFIAPLRHPENASSWDHVLDLLERTLRSVCNQTNPDFRVIIVYNEGSRLRTSHSKVIYYPVNLPPNPSYEQGNTSEAGRHAVRLDKGKKYLAGLYHARELSSTHIMLFDADDCVSMHLAEFVSRLPEHKGWFMDQGFLYKQGARYLYYLSSNFSRVCGTSHIIRFDLFDLPQRMEAVSQEYVLQALGSHIYIRDMLAVKGNMLEPLPFVGAIYMIGHGDNHGQIPGYRMVINGYEGGTQGLLQKLRVLSRFRPLTNSIRREFGLYPIR